MYRQTPRYIHLRITEWIYVSDAGIARRAAKTIPDCNDSCTICQDSLIHALSGHYRFKNCVYTHFLLDLPVQ